MPMPQEYQIAAQAHDALLAEAGEALGLTTRNQTYTVIEAVLVTFRRRLAPADVLTFAGVLPVILRAMFVAGWNGAERISDFGTPQDWAREVRALRRHHNFAPDNAVPTVARVLRRHVDADRFDKTLASLSPEAQLYWKV